MVVQTGLPARVLAPQGWDHNPLPLDELAGVHGQGLPTPEAVGLDPKQVVAIPGQTRLPPG